ncbi:MAG: hypothetical protein RIE59_19445 [Imperialibacter sp.]
MKINVLNTIRVAAAAWMIIGTFVFIVIPWWGAYNNFLEFSYHHKVANIEIRQGYRGVAHILIGSDWRLLRTEELKIQGYIEPGDSIVKEAGSKKITVFRLIDGHKLLVREFE